MHRLPPAADQFDASTWKQRHARARRWVREWPACRVSGCKLRWATNTRSVRLDQARLRLRLVTGVPGNTGGKTYERGTTEGRRTTGADPANRRRIPGRVRNEGHDRAPTTRKGARAFDGVEMGEVLDSFVERASD